VIYKRRRIATIDIGTNSLLMIVAERNEEGKLTILADESRVPKLGEGLRATRSISPQGMERTLTALSEIFAIAKSHGADEIFVTATSAAREASNQEEFLTKAEQILGCPLEIIPPNEEARLTYISVTSERGNDDPSMVVDIGGGSTEITWGLGHRFDGGRSLDLGTVKVHEGFLKEDPPTATEVDAARKEIDQRLSRVTPLGKLNHYFGTAGSFTHLASIDLALENYRWNKILDYRLTKETLNHLVARLSRSARSEIVSWPGVDPRRADVLLAGALIIERLFEKFKMDAFIVVDRGVRFGKLFSQLKGFAPPLHSAC
jgi:exopolyphosphatase / guanosine-5'-triphosphate,3'-diphosphate pyrophosphatase